MTREFRYIAIGRYTEGVNVLGYVLKELSSGSTALVCRQEVENLAINRLVSNISAQIYGGKIIMKGLNCKLSELTNYDSTGNIISKQSKKLENKEDIVISARIIEGKSTIGYVVTLRSNGIKCGEKRLSRDKVLELARNGYISNARVQMSNSKPVLRGVNCELAKLPSTSIKR